MKEIPRKAGRVAQVRKLVEREQEVDEDKSRKFNKERRNPRLARAIEVPE